jgi:hypothetical protein
MLRTARRGWKAAAPALAVAVTVVGCVPGVGGSGGALFSEVTCAAPVAVPLLGVVPWLAAVSQEGRIAMATTDRTLTIYRRGTTSVGCPYEVDPTYGYGGTVTFANHYLRIAWDGSENLYAVDGAPNQPARFYRVAPGLPAASCQTVAIDPAPSRSDVHATLAVSSDGAGAFFWDNQQEWTLDLTDPSLGIADVPCNLLAQPDTQPHVTAAFSSFPGGFLFVRNVGSQLRVIKTDAALTPQ